MPPEIGGARCPVSGCWPSCYFSERLQCGRGWRLLSSIDLFISVAYTVQKPVMLSPWGLIGLEAKTFGLNLGFVESGFGLGLVVFWPHSRVFWPRSLSSRAYKNAYFTTPNGFSISLIRSSLMLYRIRKNELLTSSYAQFLANVSPVRLSSVCLSVVCNVRAPYPAGWNFRQCFCAI